MFTKKTIKAQNSRRYKRLRANYLVKYQVPGVGGEPFVSNIKDLSAGGLKFWTENYIAEGTLVKVSFLVPPLDRQVDTLARVVRVRTSLSSQIFYAAVRFIEIPEDAKKAIDDFIETLSTLPGARKLVSSTPVVKRTVLV